MEKRRRGKGDNVGYDAWHKRVGKARGKPSLCEQCGATKGRFEWANQTGNFSDFTDYRRLCKSCHTRYDTRRHAEARPRIHCVVCGDEMLNTQPSRRHCSHNCYQLGYQRRKREKAKSDAGPKSCATCHNPFMPYRSSGQYCSTKCGSAAAYKRTKAKRAAKWPTILCAICGKPSVAKRPEKIYCSIQCGRVAVEQRRLKAVAERRKSAQGEGAVE